MVLKQVELVTEVLAVAVAIKLLLVQEQAVKVIMVELVQQTLPISQVVEVVAQER